MKQRTINRFVEFILSKKLIKKNESILAGVSGGVDSIVMLDLLCSIKERFGLSISVAHVNYNLRGMDSVKDKELVEKICKKNDIPCFVKDVNLKQGNENKSIQIPARVMRYDFYNEICRRENIDKIVIAHNADDNAETVLLHLFRGSGIEGMRGIPVKRDNIIRPVLFLKRSEILEYALENHLRFRHDKSNFEDKYSRNFLRLKILPKVSDKINPMAVENINRFSGIFSEFLSFADGYVKNAVKSAQTIKNDSEFSLDIKKLNNYISFIKEKVIQESYQNFFDEALSSSKVFKILTLLDSQTGRKLILKKDIVLWKERGQLIFKTLPKKGILESPISFYLNETIEFGQNKISAVEVKKSIMNNDRDIEFIDKDKIKDNFLIRIWKDGDYFYPLGMKNRKKVSDFLSDAKVKSSEKKKVPVLLNGDKIIWIPGFRLDDRVKCSKETKSFVKLEIERN